MTDNTPDDADDLPEWVWEIVERHDLGLRADTPLGGAAVLLTDAAEALTELGRTVFREQALTPATRERAAACATMIADALRLAPLCPDEPSAGTITEAPDSTLTWAPLGPVHDQQRIIAAAFQRDDADPADQVGRGRGTDDEYHSPR